MKVFKSVSGVHFYACFITLLYSADVIFRATRKNNYVTTVSSYQRITMGITAAFSIYLAIRLLIEGRRLMLDENKK